MQGRYLRWLAGGLASIGLAMGAGEFAAPAEGPVAFRRDKIALDTDTIAGLSKQLETLARGLAADKAATRRRAAQLLALAVALDPGNATARELITAYEQGRHKADAEPRRLEECRARISQYVAWLETPAAGSHGQALASCLRDVIALANPQQPEAVETGAWTGWVPHISAYEPPAIVKNDPTRNPRPRVVAPDAKNEILLTKAQVHTLLWRKAGKDDSSNWVLAPAPLQMSATRTDVGREWKRPFSIVIASLQDGSSFAQTSTTLCNLLKKTHPSLPAGYQILISSKELDQSIQSKKRQSLSAAAAVLASSALTGHEPEAIIIGQIDETGAFKLPTAFWDQLLALGKGSGQRLVLPADAAATLPSFLALEKPGFFLSYEVLLAANFQQLLDLSAKAPQGALATATAKFHAIQDKVGSQDVRQYIGNRFVRQRLGEILQDAPYHYSAKMLLIQASGNRPTLVTRPVLAAELRRALEPMDWIVKKAGLISAPWTARPENGIPSNNSGTFEFSAAEITQFVPTLDLCRTRIDSLERYAEKNDRELVDRAHKAATAIRNLDKASRTRGYSYVVSDAIRSASSDLRSLHKDLSETLAREAGDPPSR